MSRTVESMSKVEVPPRSHTTVTTLDSASFSPRMGEERRHWPAAALAMMLGLSAITGCGEPKPVPRTPTVPGAPERARGVQPLPQSFTMKEKVQLIGTDMFISSGEGKHGRVEQRLLKLGKTFQYFDQAGMLQATAHQKFISFGVQIDITDAQGKKLGSVTEEVEKSFFKVRTSYLIHDADGKLLAKSVKLDLLATKVEMRDPAGKLLVTMSRPALNLLSDTWTVDAPGGIDKRLVIFVPAFKTSADASR